MKMKPSGTITISGTNIRRTAGGEWCVSRHGKVLGYVALLSEVEPFLQAEEDRIRRRLAVARHVAEERAADRRAEEMTRR